MQNSSKAKTVEMKIRRMQSTDFPFDGIVFRRLQSVPIKLVKNFFRRKIFSSKIYFRREFFRLKMFSTKSLFDEKSQCRIDAKKLLLKVLL